MGNYSNNMYRDPTEEPSFTKSVLEEFNPKHPTRLIKNLTVGSFTMAALNRSNWSNLSRGAGVPWTGIYGLRNIFAGEQAYSKVWPISKSNLPSRGIEAIIRGFNPNLAERYSKAGLFGYGGIFNPNQPGRSSKNIRTMLSKIVGGTDVIERTKLATGWKDILKAQGVTNIPGVKTQKMMYGEYKKTFSRIQSRGFFKTAYYATIGEEEFARKTFAKSKKADMAAKALGKNLKKASILRLGGMLGKGLNVALWAPLAFELASLGTETLLNIAAKPGRQISEKIGDLSNRKMEMGGIVGKGFYTSAAATERQRALQAIGKNNLQARGLMGREGELQHVGNTW